MTAIVPPHPIFGFDVLDDFRLPFRAQSANSHVVSRSFKSGLTANRDSRSPSDASRAHKRDKQLARNQFQHTRKKSSRARYPPDGAQPPNAFYIPPMTLPNGKMLACMFDYSETYCTRQ